MAIELWMVGKTKVPYVNQGFDFYLKRIFHYQKMKIMYLQEAKASAKTPIQLFKEKEAEIIFKQLTESDYLVLFDEKGKQHDSTGFSEQITHIKEHYPNKRCIFLIGGVYGFSDDIRNRANSIISLSKMTFPHQLVRLLVAEQFYRAHTIINNESYHH